MKQFLLFSLFIYIQSCLFAQNPVADFDVNIIYTCGLATTEFINKSQNATRFLWDTDGSGSYLVKYEPRGSNFTKNKSWNVTLIAQGNGMSDTLTKRVEIFHTRVKFDYALPDSNEYAPMEVQFFNTSDIRPEDTLTCHWEFGDGIYSEEINPVHIYQKPGTYYVELKGFKNGECKLYISKYIVVKDSAQTGEFSFITSDCFFNVEDLPCEYGKHFEIRNDSIIIHGSYFGNCATTKTATAQINNDTVFIKIWETGELATCECYSCFEIVIANITKRSMIISFDNKIFLATISGVIKKKWNEQIIDVVPNPTSNYLIIKINNDSNNLLKFQLIDIFGKIRQSGIVNHPYLIQIDRRKVTNGLYIIVLQIDTGIRFSKRILID